MTHKNPYRPRSGRVWVAASVRLSDFHESEADRIRRWMAADFTTALGTSQRDRRRLLTGHPRLTKSHRKRVLRAARSHEQQARRLRQVQQSWGIRP